jgi:hypothetical protein
MSTQIIISTFFFFFVLILIHEEDLRIFYCHRFRIDKADMVDIFRIIFFLSLAFLPECLNVLAAIPSPQTQQVS